MGFILLSAITFVSAFALFQIELIAAKLFLPIYGGSYLVWGACVVFFQAILFLGYISAHYLISRYGIASYLKIHAVFLLIPLLFFPGHAIHLPQHTGHLPLVMDVFWRLLMTVGPVFFVLSTVSLVTQSWLAQSTLARAKYPYLLYAISNAGSFGALLTYPFIFEYFLTNTEMLNIWRVIYLVLIALHIIAFYCVRVAQGAANIQTEDGAVAVNRGQLFKWLILSASAVILFLSVTNIMTYEVAPIPLLWVIPLAIYLLSFVLCFKERPFFPRWMQVSIPSILVLSVILYFQSRFVFLPPLVTLVVFLVFLMCLCMHIQHELIKSKPAVKDLTLFYVMISLGGFVGGFITSWIIPVISKAPIEFLLGLLGVAVLLSGRWIKIAVSVLLLLALAAESVVKPHPSVYRQRNYYGIYDIFDNSREKVRTMVHGTTLHGLEFIDPKQRWIPLGYYSPRTPMGEILSQNYFEADRIAAIGLGAGTIAVYAKPTMPMDFYELDPDVVDIAKKYFWYLSFSSLWVDVIVGDARLQLQQHNDRRYGTMVIDAFGGDSVPVHLINADVLAKYRSMLTERGGILFHIPNRYFDLEPVIAHIAAATGAMAAVKNSSLDGITMRTVWAVVTWDRERYMHLITDQGWRPLLPEMYKPMRVWTDDYSSVLPIVKWNSIFDEFKHFRLWAAR